MHSYRWTEHDERAFPGLDFWGWADWPNWLLQGLSSPVRLLAQVCCVVFLPHWGVLKVTGSATSAYRRLKTL